MYKKITEQLELGIERLIFASRWLLAPMFVGLALSLALLMVKFIEALWHNARHTLHATEAQMILDTLSLVDIVLTGSLLVIVIFSGYENFVSKIDHSGHEDWPAWMGTIDFTALKLKLLSSIVAISAIQLLKQFMALKTTTDRELAWSVGIHLVFVVSSVLLALSDRIAHGSPQAESHEPAAAPATGAPHTASAQTAMAAHGASSGAKRK